MNTRNKHVLRFTVGDLSIGALPPNVVGSVKQRHTPDVVGGTYALSKSARHHTPRQLR